MIFDIHTLRLMNALLALSAFPAAVYMISVLNKESILIPSKAKMMHVLNDILRLIFLGVSIGALLNAILSLLLVANIDWQYSIFGIPSDSFGDVLFNARNFIINGVFSFSSWSLVLFRKVVKEHVDAK